MNPHSALAPLVHGGDLAAARKLFPGVPEPFLDLSTGINPHSYPVPELSADLFTKLPEPVAVERLAEIAAKTYAAPSQAHVAVAPGSQIVVTLAAGFVPPGRALVLGPTYAEHARAAALTGHAVEEVSDIEQLGDAELAIVVNPNNPDGRVVAKEDLLTIAGRLARRGGLLLVDEAFMEAGPLTESVAGSVGRGNIVVLRSFGKFFGLPGLRLSFALSGSEITARLRAALGPWPVSGTTLTIGARALADTAWVEAAREKLARAAVRLDGVLRAGGLKVLGGTTLFRLVESAAADDVFRHLGSAGILVRRFEERPQVLRFGLPGGEADWQRLTSTLASLRRWPAGG
jgi:cobalamin biosynthesis protein CobC